MLVDALGDSRGIVLFGAGAGGDPARYEALIAAAASAGFVVAAPVHERFDGRTVTDNRMRERAVGLADALCEVDRRDLPVVAAGHSAGGGQRSACRRTPLGPRRATDPVRVEPRVAKVVAIAPTVGGPGTVRARRSPRSGRRAVGAADAVTPPETAEILRAAPETSACTSTKASGTWTSSATFPPSVAPSLALTTMHS